MPYYAGVMTVAKTLFVGLAAAGCAIIFTVVSVSAQGEGSRVEVMVCPDANGSSMVISAPQSDSVVDKSKVTVSGSVLHISQIDFFIDNVYNNTLALGNLDTTFASTLTLSPGTHTIKLVATDSCSQATHTESIVITYEPAIQPSVGTEIETAVEGQVRSPVDADAVVTERSPLESFVHNAIVPPLVSIGRALDIISSEGKVPSNEGANIVRSGLFVASSALVLSALYVSMLGALPAKLALLGQSQSKLVAIMTTSGLVAMLLVFML